MASLLGKHHIAANPASLVDGDSIAAYLTDAAGALLTSSLIGGKQRLDANTPSEFAGDTAATFGTDYGTSMFGQRNDAGTTLATADGHYAPLQLDANGALRVSGSFSVSFTAEHNEDAPFTNGDSGIATLLVRQDTLAVSTSADGDYGSFKSNNLGELYVHDTSALAELVLIKGDTASIVTNTGNTATNTSTIAALSHLDGAVWAAGSTGIEALAVRKDSQGASTGVQDGDWSPFQTWSEGSLKVVDIANGTILQQQVSVTNVAAQVPAANLANRKTLMLQNTGANKLYIGSATVTTAGATSGIELPANSFMELECGPAVNVYAVKTGAAANNLNVLEMA